MSIKCIGADVNERGRQTTLVEPCEMTMAGLELASLGSEDPRLVRPQDLLLERQLAQEFVDLVQPGSIGSAEFQCEIECGFS